ncbi:MAG: hypothetical protein B7Z73_15525 [Planctomycetia bacterium 21-64-5]|nr:MAG: hypothetical protein B7Z73_15525 [Planctomycetia bacterium 21-64-5]
MTGGVDLPADRLRSDVDHLRGLVVDCELDKHIVRLLALHPELRDRFGDRDLASLDLLAKRALLDEMNEILGIRPPSHSRP